MRVCSQFPALHGPGLPQVLPTLTRISSSLGPSWCPSAHREDPEGQG